MQERHFRWMDSEGVELYIYVWFPDPEVSAKAVVQISHGMAETAVRYQRVASVLTSQGYIVYASDHRGHGRTAGSPEKVGLFDRDSFNRMCENMADVTNLIREHHPELPIFLLGHSLGSFLSQQYMYKHAEKVNGIILSGSNGKLGASLLFGAWLAAIEAKLKGEQYRSKLMNGLIFGAYNKAFRPNRTEFDWLSRDTAEVDAYIHDPFCGTVFAAGYYRDFLMGLIEIHRLENMQKIPKSLPVYLFSGDQDPVGLMGKGFRQLLQMYQDLGLTQVSSKLYSGGRHEMLNETNRDEVMGDLLAWLDAQVEAIRG
jgi:alpha-beta hydrolase superfamily lysophospholipase